MPRVNPKNVVNLLAAEYADITESETTAADQHMKTQIMDLMQANLMGDVDEEETLDFLGDEEDREPVSGDVSEDDGYERDKVDTSEDDEDPNYQPSNGSEAGQSRTPQDKVPLEYKRKAINFWKNQTKKPRPTKSVLRRYPKAKNASTLCRWETALCRGL